MKDLATVLLIASACCGLLYVCDEWRLRRSAKRIQAAEDLAEVERITATWAPKPKWNYRRHGRFAKKPYARFTVRTLYDETN